MRFKNTSGAIKIYAVAGTQTVLFSLDIARSKVAEMEFIGFWFERRDKEDKKLLLNGSKHFKSLTEDPTISDPKVKNKSLVQSYFWKDYQADPGQTYTYTVSAMFGTAQKFTPKYTTKIKVTTEALLAGPHSVYFNYGVTGSQAYNRKFKRELITNLTRGKQEQAYDLLGRELWQDGLLEFVKQAQGSTYQLYGAFYEIQYLPFLKALKQAANSGATVQIVYNNKTEQKDENEKCLKKAGLKSLCFPRTKVSQPHNKFIVLCENNKPKQVWTGSTNITLRGIFGHSNTGHWIRNTKIAEQYFRYWNTIKDDPSKAAVAAVCEKLQVDTDLEKLEKGTYVFFSPRTSDTHLKNYAALINSASEMVCMILPFNIEDIFRQVYTEDKKYLRYLLFEKASEAKSVQSNDFDLMVTAGAILEEPVEQWVKEISTSTTVKAGIRYVHNKFFLIDPLSDVPVVITGSANFSDESIVRNDENTLVIKGDTRVADIYLTEFSRMFEHFWPRYLRKLPKSRRMGKGFDKPLDEEYVWFNDYYDTDKLGCKRKQVFSKMKKAKES